MRMYQRKVRIVSRRVKSNGAKKTRVRRKRR